MKKINLQNWLQFPKWMFGQCTKQFGRRNNPLHALNQRAPDEGNWKSSQLPGPLHRRSSRGLSPYRRFLLWIWARRCEQRELIHSRNERQEPVQHLMVPLPIPPDLLHPEPGVRFRHHIILAPLMSMPEAPVHQNTGAIFPQHDVRLARQPRMIEPIPESPTPQKFPDKNLRFGIPAPYCRHIVVALFYG